MLLAALAPQAGALTPTGTPASTPASTPAGAWASAPAKAAPRSTVTATEQEVTEGDLLTLRVTVGKPTSAKRVTLQRWEKPYSWSTGRWVAVRSAKAKRKLTFRTTVTTLNTAQYRVSVTYKKRAKPVVSKAAKVAVWRWLPLTSFMPYQQAGRPASHTTAVNGRPGIVWGPYSSSAAGWVSRHTPGRNCTAFRGVAALTDSSDDGAMGLIEVAADGDTLWSSTELVPGMVVPFTVPLDLRPYRLAVTGLNLSEDTTLRTIPVVVDAELFCTGI